MKAAVYLIAAAVSLASCSPSKKVTERTKVETSIDSVATSEASSKQTYTMIDTTRTSETTLTITEVEFFPKAATADTIGLTPAGVGSVKVWRQIVIGKKDEQRGNVTTSERTDTTATTTSVAKRGSYETKTRDVEKKRINWLPWVMFAAGAAAIVFVVLKTKSKT